MSDTCHHEWVVIGMGIDLDNEPITIEQCSICYVFNTHHIEHSKI